MSSSKKISDLENKVKELEKQIEEMEKPDVSSYLATEERLKKELDQLKSQNI